ncbi:hypothetical protein M8C13_42045 [Crossiella sp. SN42]|uniref:hypothetical protein n=1 Tax=Crossiella sp. SN42 TaxID=2944808 RepID=UPI00207D429A|nr:hypothetical protein [Crossiella sp. SN42]MCO1582351.1 hypothetical protein [Crossiella sp. SN42]
MADPARHIPLYARLALAVLLGGFAAAPLVTTVLVGLFADTVWLWVAVLGALALAVLWLLCWALAAATPTVTPRTATPAGRRGWALLIAPAAAALSVLLWLPIDLLGLVNGLETIPLGLVGGLGLGLTVLVDWLLARRVTG